mgnify:CR=1 FL=1
MPSEAPAKIEKIDDDELRILWEDAHESLFSFRFLRQRCPCAQCKDEWTGRRLLDPEAVPAGLKALSAGMVGNYALSFQFSDRHGSGVYSFALLRALCPCAGCANKETPG